MALYVDMETQKASQMVLVVEDEPFIRMSTAAALEDAGYAVLEAKDAAEAVEVLAIYHAIDVVVTDVRMPGQMDGLGLTKLLHREYPDISVVVVSGTACPDVARKAGAVAFLRKPFGMDNVVQAVRSITPRSPMPPQNRRAA